MAAQAPRLDRWFSHPWAPRLAILAGLLLSLPSLGSGFFADDDALLAYLDKRLPFTPPWYDLYRFVPDTSAETMALVARGQFPWWTAPGLRLHLVRPLSSALFALDHAIFGVSPVGFHVHSILWWGLVLLAVSALLRRILPAPTAALALLVFALSSAHQQPYAWASARHVLVAAAPAIFGLTAAVRARQERWAPGRWLAPLGIIVGLLGGEVALGALAFWVTYEVFGPSRPAAWGERARRAATPIALGLAYLVVYALVGGGARDSGGYVDPSTPGLFAVAAVTRFPALLAAALTSSPADLSTALPAAPFVVLAAVGAALAALLWRGCSSFIDDGERAAMRWLLPGALLAMLGAVGGFPGSRQLLVADVAWASLFAILVRHGFRAGSGAMLRRAIAGLEVALHVVAPPLMVLGLTASSTQMTSAVRTLAHAALADGPPDRRVFVAQASDPMAFLYPLALIAREGETDRRACFSLLSGTKRDVRITRTGPASLRIEPLGGAMLRGSFEGLYRARRLGFHVGDEVTTCGARVRVLAVDEDSLPTLIEATVEDAGGLDDPRVRVLAWQEGTLRPLHLSVGERVEIPWSAGPTRVF